MTSQRFLVMQGLPASGKSTWAKDFVARMGNKNWAIISKDDIRPVVLAGRKWTPKLEGEILKRENELILAALKTGLSVISDNTNLNPKHIERYRQFAQQYKIELELVDFTGVTPEECVKRDLHRGDKAVGADVIYQTWYKWIAPKNGRLPYAHSGKTCIISDLDGTLCLFGDKNPFDRDFTADEPNLPLMCVINGLQTAYPVHDLILFSGRDSKFRDQTEQWLKYWNIKYAALYMRAEGDRRKDWVVKEEFLLKYILGNYNVLAVFDDRQQVIRHVWHKYGIFCFNCAQHTFDFDMVK